MLSSTWFEQMFDEAQREWLRVSGQATNLANTTARVDDLIVEVSPGNGKGHPAFFDPKTYTINVDPTICAEGVHPAKINLSTESGRMTHPHFTGAVKHEASHRAYTQWEIPQEPAMRRVAQAALLLEEPRHEGFTVRANPIERTYFAACFATIVARSTEINGPWDAATMVGLAMGRVLAGVLLPSEVEGLEPVLRETLGDDRYDALLAIVGEAVANDRHDDTEAMLDLARRFLAAFDAGEPEGSDEGQGESVKGMCGHSAPTGSGDSDDSDSTDSGDNGDSTDGSSDSGDSDKADGPLAETMRNIAKEISDKIDRNAEQQAAAAAAAERRAQQQKEASQQKTVKQKAEKVFRPGAHAKALIGRRNPAPKERGAAGALAKALGKARHREMHTVTRDSATPGGRLRGNVAVRAAAERARGAMVTAEPWRRKVHLRAEQPPLSVGIMCDVSGSMSAFTSPIASAAWIVANAVQRVDGTSATVLYDEAVQPVVRPGERPDQVQEFTANGYTEDFVGAVQALDGALGWSGATGGARVLVIVSDGIYTSDQWANGQKEIDRLIRNGVTVLWLGMQAMSDRPMRGAAYVATPDPVTAIDRIGKTLVSALENA